MNPQVPIPSDTPACPASKDALKDDFCQGQAHVSHPEQVERDAAASAAAGKPPRGDDTAGGVSS